MSRTTCQSSIWGWFWGGMEIGRGGLKEIEAGLRGLADSLDYVERYETESRYWDPGLHLRKEIQRSLAMIGSSDVDWPQFIANGERLGFEFEEEIDEYQKQFEDYVIGDGDGGGNG